MRIAARYRFYPSTYISFHSVSNSSIIPIKKPLVKGYKNGKISLNKGMIKL